jgi:hypothetical protein
MMRLVQVGAAAIAVAAFALASGTVAEAKQCKKCSGVGITEIGSLSALEVEKVFNGATGKGKIHTKCGGPLLECKSTQFACK